MLFPKLLQKCSHVRADGFREGSVPIVDHAVNLGLDQQLCPLTSLELRITETFTIEPPSGQERPSPSWHLNHVFLAGLVLRCPFHRSPSQLHCELRLRLVAAKLLDTTGVKKQLISSFQTIIVGQSSQFRAASPDSANTQMSYD